MPEKVLVIRKVQASMRASVWALMQAVGRQYGFGGTFREQQLELELANGSTLICRGLDDPEKLKSIAGITRIWVEEATELKPGDWDVLDDRMRHPNHPRQQVVLSFNPTSVHSWIYKRFFEAPDEFTASNRLEIVTTYRDNPYLPEAYRRKMEARTDALYRAVYVDGQWGVPTGTIYGTFKVCDWAQVPETAQRYYGLDHGYNAPTALVEVIEADPLTYVRTVLYERNLTGEDVARRMAELGIDRRAVIFADPEDPGRNQAIQRAGFNLHPANKGPGSVRAGIDHVLSRQASLRVAEGDPLLAEAAAYTYKMRADGEPLDEPVKANDHALDALRYALSDYARLTGGGFLGVV